MTLKPNTLARSATAVPTRPVTSYTNYYITEISVTLTNEKVGE